MNETLEEFGASVKFGTVSASRPGFARVRLPDFDNMRTMWLPIAYPKTRDDQACWTYDNGEHVAAAVLARFNRFPCPHLKTDITPNDCGRFALRSCPTSNAREVRHWKACQSCPHKPEVKS